MKDSYFLLRLLQANRQQLEKLLGKDWPAFLRLLESTLGSFLNSRPRRGSSRDLRETVERVTRGAEEWAAVVLRDVVHGASERKTPAGGEIEVALPDSRSVVLTVPEDIPAGRVKAAEVAKEAERMREIVLKAQAARRPEASALPPSWLDNGEHYAPPDPGTKSPGGWRYEVAVDGEDDPVRAGLAVPAEEVAPEERPMRGEHPPRPAAPPEERRINVWIAERDQDPRRPLDPQEPYTLCFQTAQPRASSLVSGPQTLISSADIPDAGLQTEWVVISTDVDFQPSRPDVEVGGTAGATTARFSLLIPKSGDSPVRQLAIRTRSRGPAKVSIVVFALSQHGRRERYRELELTLTVEVRLETDTPALAKTEEQVVADRHLGLGTTHEWTTPPGHLTLTVPKAAPVVLVDASYGAQEIDNEEILTPWDVKKLAGRIDNVRGAAEKLRGKWEAYFNDIDAASLPPLLQSYRFEADQDWSRLQSRADPAHEAAWDTVKVSPELREMAVAGHALYQALFPKDSDLRGWVDALPPGSRLEISWKDGEVSNIPWGLLYRKPAPAAGAEVEATDFLGLRYRIAYTTHKTSARSKALGAPSKAHQASFLYWGDHPADITGAEARWQRGLWSGLPNQVLVPAATSADRRGELLRLWNAPNPSPMAVLYFFCQCKVGSGNDPVLSFGDAAADILRRTDLAGGDLADRPLVFANACTTVSADPYIANELEATFFERGCRGFLGTETKVPIPLAARFASIFFEFFCRRVDPQPMAAGEALAQSRIFLWTRYRNIGGLFYTYINQYELFLADDAEVVAMRI